MTSHSSRNSKSSGTSTAGSGSFYSESHSLSGPRASSGFGISRDFSASGSVKGSASFEGSKDVKGSTSGSSASPSSSGSVEGKIEIHLSFSFRKVFAFGDSCTYTGNAKILGTVKNFVGANIAKAFESANPNFIFSGRSSNGRLVVDFLCDALNISALQPFQAIATNTAANLNWGVNFAVAGATSLSGDFFANHKIGHGLLWKGIPLGFQTQIEWFNEFLANIGFRGKSEEESKQEIENTLIWLGQIGVDDYARVIGSSISLRWLTDITVTVLDSGAKFVVVQGLPPVGCWPLAKLFTPQFAKDELGCSALINAAVLLQKTLDEFRRKYGPDRTIVYADYFNAYKTIMADLAGYGFSDADNARCGAVGGFLNFNLHILCGMLGTSTCSNPEAHVQWDGFHLTEAMHKQITHLFLYKGFCKASFAEVVRKHRNLHRLRP
ncbi:hypothetical protein PTKIN_Ptkin17bG0093500 [Pterospermum kingtungense]